MAGINKVILVGNLGQDPQTNYATDGRAITTISIATSESWTDKNSGQKQEKTEWHRVVIFGKPAENAKTYLKKGSKVYIEGKLQTRKWQDKSGLDRYTTEVIVSGFGGVLQFLDSRGGGGSQPYNDDDQTAPNNQQSAPQNQPAQTPVVEDDFDDDIPF